MDFTTSPTSSFAGAPPPIPTRTRLNSTRRPSHDPVNSVKRQSIPPSASPEVISNLITSLSGISKPAEDYFDNHPSSPGSTGPGGGGRGASLSLPSSPGRGNRSLSPGSFGVDYGAYNRPSLTDLRSDPLSLDEIAASPPIIRTSKPPSGYSSITAPNNSRSRQSSTNREGGFRSFIRSSSAGASRPSSGGSGVRSDEQSIGNLSIEPGTAPEPELKQRRSFDSWGKKASRSAKGLMYMSSKERLRDKELGRRQGSVGAMSSNSLHNQGTGPGVAASSHSNSKPDPFMAETPICEEPLVTNESVWPSPERASSTQAIPPRESSLKKSTPNSKRMGRRPKREEEDVLEERPEVPEKDVRRAHRKVPAQLDLQNQPDNNDKQNGLANPPSIVPALAPSHTQTPTSQRFLESIRDDYLAFDGHAPEVPEKDGAPIAAASKGRTRSNHSIDNGNRTRSTPQSPTSGDDGRTKRSSSRLKRLSRQASPTPESKASQDQQRDDLGGVPLERVDSVDSIDDAVDTYLASTRLTQKIKHPQTGRTICFSEVGDPEGSAVFCCVGMGLTRYITAFYDELALTLKLRLITPDRPGVGDSEPYSDGTATPLSWPDDVYAICQSLKITKFSILAHSAGAIYALATALRMPQHIRGRIHLLAPWIPPSQMNTFGGSQTSPPTNAIPTAQRILRALPTPMLKVANSSFMSATSTSITTSLPKNPKRAKRKAGQGNPRDSGATLDKENIRHDANGKDGQNGANEVDDGRNGNGNVSRASHRSEAYTDTAVLTSAVSAMDDKERQMAYDIRLTHAIWALATTGANPAVDLLTCLERRHTIGFRYVDINRPVVIHHGSRDTRVPVDNVRWLGKTMRRCEVRVLEGEGHGLMASATVMGSVLMEISKEWEDWMRVTGADGRREKERERGRREAFSRA